MTVGIIAEYNPFHAGHKYQIAEVRKIFPNAEIVAVMSGNFTQRGEPAILDKWTRASLAVEGGADLVFELPFFSAVRSAQDFARGGVRLLSGMGIIDKLAFGAETSDLKLLQNIAKINLAEKIKSEMSAGISYAAAVQKILQVNMLPNTILAVEYLRALPKNIEPLLIPRIGADYREEILQEKFSSATAIRAEVYKKNPAWEKISHSVSEKVLNALQEEKISGLVQEDFLFLPLMTKIFTSSIDDLKKIYGMREGLENLLLKSAKSAKNFSDLVSGLVNKRYQTSRVKRLFLHLLLDVTEEKIAELETADFLRVLAFNERGQKLLKKISAASSLPIISKTTRHLTEKNFLQKNFSAPYKKKFAADISATNLYGILFDSPKSFGQDFSNSPFFRN